MNILFWTEVFPKVVLIVFVVGGVVFFYKKLFFNGNPDRDPFSGTHFLREVKETPKDKFFFLESINPPFVRRSLNVKEYTVCEDVKEGFDIVIRGKLIYSKKWK